MNNVKPISARKHLALIFSLLTQKERRESINTETGHAILRPAQLGVRLRSAADRYELLFGPNPIKGLSAEMQEDKLILGVERGSTALEALQIMICACWGDKRTYTKTPDFMVAQIPYREIQADLSRLFGQPVSFGKKTCELLFDSALKRRESKETQDRVTGKKKQF